MSEFEFKPEDFAGVVWKASSRMSFHISEEDAEQVSEIANRRIAEMLAEAPTVYGSGGDGYISTQWSVFPDPFDEKFVQTLKTHEAKLVMIKEVKE